jgi:hypothetical protein
MGLLLIRVKNSSYCMMLGDVKLQDFKGEKMEASSTTRQLLLYDNNGTDAISLITNGKASCPHVCMNN